MKIGDRVEWATYRLGRRVHWGQVIEIVPSGERPRKGPSRLASAVVRGHESYLVAATVRGDKRYYWPKVEDLKVVNDDSR